MVEEITVPESDEKSENVAVDIEPKALFSIQILRLLRDAQKQHGLRHGDYQRYRGKSILMHIQIHSYHLIDMIFNPVCW